MGDDDDDDEKEKSERVKKNCIFNTCTDTILYTVYIYIHSSVRTLSDRSSEVYRGEYRVGRQPWHLIYRRTDYRD